MRNLSLLCLLLLWLASPRHAYAQASNAGDCVDALPICLPSYSQVNQPNGFGNVDLELHFNSCLRSNELNGVWYRFETDRDDLISFQITPYQAGADYDWAVYDLTNARCADIRSNPALEISCNYSQQGGPTGADGSTAFTRQDNFGGRFNARIPVRQGGQYFLYVSSFSEGTGGYTIDFNLQAGEPLITDTRPPGLEGVIAPDSCLRDSLTLVFDEYVDCRSIDPQDFELTTPDGQTFAVASLSMPECAEVPENLTRRVTLRWSRPYTAVGTYVLNLVGPIIDACGNITDAASIAFDQNDLPLVTRAVGDQVYCETAAGLRLRAWADGEDSPLLRYFWSPETGLDDPQRTDPLAFPKATTRYRVFARAGSCRSVPAEIQVTVIPKPQVALDGPSAGCANETLRWTLSGADDYHWPDFNATGPTFSAAFPAGDTVLRVVPLVQGCAGDTLRFPLRVSPAPTPSFLISRPTVCVDETVELSDPQGRIAYRYQLETAGGIRAGGQLPDGLRLYWTEPGVKSLWLEASANGCTSATLRQNLRVDPLPEAIPPPDVVWCANEAPPVLQPIVSPPSGCAYRWEPAAGLNDPSLFNPTASPDSTTTYTLTVLYGDCASEPATVRVIVEETPPVAFLESSVQFCEGAAGVRLSPVLADDEEAGGWRYLWQPTTGLDRPYAPDPVATPPQTTTYTLQRVGPQGCVGPPATIRVEVNPRPQAYAGEDLSFCRGENGVQLEGMDRFGETEFYRYRWSPATGLNDTSLREPTARPEISTLYRLVIEHTVTGCVSEPTDEASWVWVHVVERPEAHAGPDIAACEGDTIQLGDAASGGVGGFVYEWAPPDGLDDPRAQRPRLRAELSRDYVLRVESNGCWSDPDSVRISVSPRPKLEWYANEVWLCPGDSAELRLRSFDPENIRYRWKPTTGLSDSTTVPVWAKPDSTTTYTLTAIGEGCFKGSIATLPVNVRKLPQLDADYKFAPNQRYHCPGESVPIPALFGPTELPTVYRWSPPDGLNRTDVLNPIADPRVTTRYRLEVLWEGCTLRDSVDFIVGPEVNAAIEADTDRVCLGQPVKMRASGGVGSASFRWLAEGVDFTTQTPEALLYPDSSGRIGVEVSEAHCRDTAWAYVQVLPQPKADFDLAPDPFCRTGFVSFLNKSRDFRYSLWDFGDGTETVNHRHPTHEYANKGEYLVRLIVRDTGGCADTATRRALLHVMEPPEAVIQRRPQDTLYLIEAWLWAWSDNRDAVEWLWDFGDGYLARGREQSHRYDSTGTYQLRLTVIDSLGCSSADSVWIHVSDRRIWLPNVFTPNDDGVQDDWGYPLGEYRNFELLVYDRWGRLVFSANNPADRWKGQDERGGQPATEGVYYWKLKVDGRERTGSLTLLR